MAFGIFADTPIHHPVSPMPKPAGRKNIRPTKRRESGYPALHDHNFPYNIRRFSGRAKFKSRPSLSKSPSTKELCLNAVCIPAPAAGLRQTSSGLNENLPFVHPEQDDPFDCKDRDLLEE
jgi:hypothetical protein